MTIKIKAGDKVKLLEKVYSHDTIGDLLTIEDVALTAEGEYHTWPIIIGGFPYGLYEVELVQ